MTSINATLPPSLQYRGMETEADRLGRDLQRYRRLLDPFGCVTDRHIRKTLAEMIAEIEAQLRALERGPAERQTAVIGPRRASHA